ncbi:MAG: glycerophosphodiester phosphodiesterase [Candidatus Odinarchaeota archaeon]
MKNDNGVLIIAHRGASNVAPENTLKAFQKAIELKADYIEFDVHLTKDGELVIRHDANIPQSDGTMSLIKEMTIEELKGIDVGEGEKIPTFNELLEISKDNIGLLCEIKIQKIGKYLIEILKNEDLLETSMISSFIFCELKELNRIHSGLKLGLLLSERIISYQMVIKFCRKAKDNHFFAIHPYWRAVNKDIVEFAHSNNLKVNAWTEIYESINDSDLKELVNLGIDGLIHDDIEQAKRVIREN